jgi:hypothetical protein
MPNVAEAANRLDRAMTLLRETAKTAKPSDKSRLARLHNILRDELENLAGVNQNDPYGSLTASFRGAKTRIENIIEERNKLASGLVTAANILNTLSAVAALI